MPGPELKLSVGADDLPKARAALLAMAGRPRPVRSIRTTTYYDTEDDALRRHELVLRVRREHRQYVQTVTARDFAGLDGAERGAWTDRIKRASPDLDAPESGARLRDAAGDGALRPLYAVALERTEFALKPLHGCEIAVAIDRGEIRAEDGRKAPVHEIALELRAGESVVLWDVALRLLEIVPCRIETQSPGERGYYFARNMRMSPLIVPGRALTLEPEMTLDDALQTAGRRLIAALLRNEAAALDFVPEGVHQMRVAVRRLRAVLSASRAMLPEEHYRWATEELKWLSRELGPARNWDVFAENLLQPVSGALGADRDLKRLAATARRQRKTAYEHARHAMLSQRYTATLLRLSRWFEARGWRDQSVSEQSARLMAPLNKVAPVLLKRLHHKALKRARRFTTLAPPERHRLRVAVKQLRYATEFFGSLYQRGEVARYERRLKPLQDDLGHANDVRAAHALVAGLGKGEDGAIERAGGVVLGWYDRGLIDAEPQTRKHVRRFRSGEPFW